MEHAFFFTVLGFSILSLIPGTFALMIGLPGALWPSQTASALAQTNALTSGVKNAEKVQAENWFITAVRIGSFLLVTFGIFDIGMVVLYGSSLF